MARLPPSPTTRRAAARGWSRTSKMRSATAFDPAICEVDHVLDEGEIELAGIRFAVKSNVEAFDLEIPARLTAFTRT